MAVNKLAVAHERQKMALKGNILKTRVDIADKQSRLKQMKQDLMSMKAKKPGQI